MLTVHFWASGRLPFGHFRLVKKYSNLIGLEFYFIIFGGLTVFLKDQWWQAMWANVRLPRGLQVTG